MDTIAKPFGILMMWLYELTNNYMLTVILFSLVVKLILMPFQMKSKKGMMKQQLLLPQQQELQKKHGSNQQAYQQELMKLYQEEGVSPMSGCLWALIPFPILIALYGAIRTPITVMMGVAKEALQEGGVLLTKLTEAGFQSTRNTGYIQISQAQFIHEHWDTFEGTVDKLRDINYKAFGLDLGMTPSFRFWQWDWSSVSTWLPMLGLLMIPILATLLTWLPTKINKKLNAETMLAAGLEPPKEDPNAKQGQMMNVMMPLMTLWFTFIMPAALGVYWIANSVFGIIQDVILTKHYNKTVAAQSADRIAARRAREAELEAKRQESERRKAQEGAVQNASTSKKKQQNKKKKEQADKNLEWLRAQNPEEPEYEPSRVGNRRYARGRAYDPDRFAYNGVVGATESTSELDETLTEEQEEKLERAALPAADAAEEEAELSADPEDSQEEPGEESDPNEKNGENEQ